MESPVYQETVLMNLRASSIRAATYSKETLLEGEIVPWQRRIYDTSL